MIKKSFTLRILAISFIVLALPLLIDSFIFFQQAYEDSINDAKKQLKQAANFRALTLEEIQPVKQVLLQELEYLLNLNDLEPKRLNSDLEKIANFGGEFEVDILSLENQTKFKIIASTEPNHVNTTFVAHQRFEEVIQNGQGNFIRYLYSDESEQYIPYIFIARVIKSEETGNPIAILMVTSSLQKELNALLNRGKQFNTINFGMLERDGVVFASTDPELKGKYFAQVPTQTKLVEEKPILGHKQLSKNALPLISGGEPPFFEFIFQDGVQIAYRSYIPSMGISVVAYSDKEAFFGDAVRHFLLIYSLYGLILVIGAGITYWISLWISRPLKQLSFLMGEVSQGNMDVRFRKQRLGFEINILGENFNHTLDNLLKHIQHAEDERVAREVYERELAITRQAQKILIPPSLPKIENASIAGKFISSEVVHGDFYGFNKKNLKNGEDALYIGVGDTSGMGISACFYSLSTRSLILSNLSLHDDVGEILQKTNLSVLEDVGETGMFISFTLGCYQTKSKSFSYYSCGHIPGLIRRSNGEIIAMTTAGAALGLLEEKDYTATSMQLDSGDLLLLFTDGVLKAVNEKQQHFSREQIYNFLQKGSWNDAQEVVDGLTKELMDFVGDLPQEDEICILALKVE